VGEVIMEWGGNSDGFVWYDLGKGGKVREEGRGKMKK
jgi:hypothetical protein